ncbi:MAG: DUF2330 domain-containing protein [Polyangiaceae bacterium]
MNLSRLALGAAAAIAAVTVAGERRASACGGCFTPPQQGVSDITDERMLLAVSPVQSTLYDQIKYSGSPSNFAWVLPIKGTVQVGLSADVLFDSVAALTQTVIYPPPLNCPAPQCPAPPLNAAVGFAGGGASTGAGDVQVLVSQNVGPYQTVQLHSTDGTALDNWLAQNGYNIPTAVQPILAAYNAEGFDFLAMKLLPGQGVQSMRPVRVTTPGASLSLPLRMASIGTGAITGITIWVVADGRYEPQNFPFFHIDDSALVWDFAVSSSNYTTLRTQHEADLKNAGWEIESSIDLNEMSITNVIQSGGQYYGGGRGGGIPVQPSDPALDYLPIGDADAGTAGDAGGDGGYESAEQVRADDIAALFVGLTGPTVRVTRIRSDIAQTAMTKDFVITASSDQSELSNVHALTNSVNATCPVYNGCTYVGTGTPSQAAATADGGYVASVSPDGGVIVTPATKGGGCNTSPGDNGSGLGLGALAGLLGLVAARAVKARRRA